MYRWNPESAFDEALDSESDHVVDDLIDALDRVLVDPLAEATRVPGTTRRPDRYMTILPHGYVVSFVPYPKGIPPHADPALRVLSFGKNPLLSLDD